MTKEKKEKRLAQAAKLAQLTFLLARACEDKEQYFTKLFGLTNAEFRCMRFLDCECLFSVKELAKIMGLTSGRITQIITSLEKKNYISREIDLNDRRNIKVRLTETAQPFIKQVIEQHVLLHEKVLEHIPLEARDSVLVAIEELLNSLTAWSRNHIN
ncbi:MAG: MarR family transcriptional regulator [Ignavibacteria bacterium]|nr:MarR family transcriptional regulator [Ignavibacteria bacterium]